MSICQDCGGSGSRLPLYRRIPIKCRACQGTGRQAQTVSPSQIRRDDEGRSIKRLSDEEEER